MECISLSEDGAPAATPGFRQSKEFVLVSGKPVF
jgi:hypothetical protein